VMLSSKSDTVKDDIGFRTIEVKGEKIFLNGESIFLKGVNFHEEIASQKRRACTSADSYFLLTQAQELGCNFVRLAHYAQNEATVRLADKVGVLLWEEIPVWQSIKFKSTEVCDHIKAMMKETIMRDKNRCAIIMWSISNETGSYKERNQFLSSLANSTRALDPTRLVTSALSRVSTKKVGDKYVLSLNDPLIQSLDIIGVNRYMGWYAPFPCDPSNLEWEIAPGKPVIVSEFGGAAVYGHITKDSDNINSWSEGYQAQLYRDNLTSFKNFPNLVGTCPWALFDFRSPTRPQAKFQRGWNRKGLISPEGGKKEAWYIMQNYYEKMDQ